MSAQNPNYFLIPEHMRSGMRDYIERGVPTGTFLRLILSNDFLAVAGHGDIINQQALFDYCRFMYNEMPAMAKGNPENYAYWVETKGLEGLEAKRAQANSSM